MVQSIDIGALVASLDRIIVEAADLEARFADELLQVHPEFQASARNLIAYVALRHTDIRQLQLQLATLGLSSLGRAERNVLATIHAVRNALAKIDGDANYKPVAVDESFEEADGRTRRHVHDLLGEEPDGRDARIMVTLPAEAADDYSLVCKLVESGMEVARINCAHDEEAAWLRMVGNVRKAGDEMGRCCRVAMDLAGPKLRTGVLRPGPGVVRIRPKRDATGRTVAPRRFRMVPEDSAWRPKSVIAVPVSRDCVEYAEAGDRISIHDTRGKKREFNVVGKDDKGLKLECFKTAYIGTGSLIKLHGSGSEEPRSFRIGKLPAAEEPILLREGDELRLDRDSVPGEPAVLGADGSVIDIAHISCRQPEVFGSVDPGAPVRLNDGKIEGTIKSICGDGLIIEITKAKRHGSRLRGDKGINFPGSEIRIQGLTESDKLHLAFIAQHADAVSMSFVRKPKDILLLQEELTRYRANKIGIIAKIETLKGFNDLPRLLLATMRHYPAGVMIARGDLAVECGWERLAEVQEEVLWLCEAAEMPVIWATQVLEQKAHKGRPSRAEITDAAMSQRADCVMLNKGPYILSAIRMLDDILSRMQGHQHKKSPKLRKLTISDV